MKRFGLIGHPIAHSLSPALFKAGYDGRYPYELIETSDFEEAYRRFQQEYDGINVTAPFKELAFRKADILSEECQRIGATNLLIKTPDGIKAYNSDYLGVRLWLEDVAVTLFENRSGTDRKAQQCRDTRVSKTFEESRSSDGARDCQAIPAYQSGLSRSDWGSDRRPVRKAQQRRDTRVSKTFEESHSSDGTRDCQTIPACPLGLSRSDWGSDRRPITLVVGLGGAGKAAAEAARSLGFDTILMNRTLHHEGIRPLDDFCECFRKADIIIYNIPAAISQLAELTDYDFKGISEKDDGQLRPKFILEANYKNPSFGNVLIERMKTANPLAEYTSGKTWLLYQALTGYELFTGEKPDLVSMSAVI